MTLKKWILVFAIAIVVIGFIAAGGNELLTLENLKRHQQSLGDWIDSNLPIALSAFVVVYVLVTALSLPGATVMTLAGGAFFGNLYGFAAVSLASTVGASLAFLAARFLVRDSLRKRYGDTVAKMDRGIEKDGAFYLATLRLVPVFPFFLINLAMGLTAMKLRTYAVVSWVAMLPGTFVYVNAGTQLGQIESTGDIVSADLLLSFALLGLFPLIAKFVVGLYPPPQGVRRLAEARAFRLQPAGYWRWFRRSGFRLYCGGGESEGCPDRKTQDGRRLPQYRLRALQSPDSQRQGGGYAAPCQSVRAGIGAGQRLVQQHHEPRQGGDCES